MKRNVKKQNNLPCDPRLEREIIGGCLGEDGSKLSEARSIISEEHFTQELHRLVWRALCRLADTGRALTLIELHAEMNAHGDAVSLGELLDFDGMNWWAVDKYLGRLAELTKRRRLMLRGQQLTLSASDESSPVDQVAGEAIQGIQSDIDGVTHNTPESAGEIVEALGGMEKFFAAVKGVRTPWPSVNHVTAGWQPGDLVLIAARPSMGKTAFALNAIVYAAGRGVPSVFYSFEMSAESILKRLVSLRTGITYHDLIRGDLNVIEKKSALNAIAWVDGMPLRIVGASGRTAMAVRSHAERLSRRGKCGMIVLDYIGLVRGSDSAENRNKQLGEVCRQLKELATQLNIPALVLSQLSRATESRNDKRPMMGDLRDSGELEEHADLIAMLHRPGYYDRKNPELELIAELIIAKQRNGDTPIIQLDFHRQSGKFVDPDERQEPTRQHENLAFGA